MALPLIAVVAACGGAADRGGSVVETDSAGVRLVVNAAPAWAERGDWRRSPEPVLVIGGSADPAAEAAAQQLYRVTGAQRLSDGRIVIANDGTKELRYFDARGRHLRSVGREGGGPGEFRHITALRALAGDTLRVYDSRLRRFSDIDAEGRFVRSVPVSDGFTPTLLLPQLIEGGRLLAPGGFSFGVNSPSGLLRPDYSLYLYDPVTGAADTVGTFPGTSWWVEVEGRSVSTTQVPFSADTYFAGDRDRLYAVLSDRAEIRVLAHDGALLRIVRLERERQRVTDDLYAAAVERSLDRVRSDNRRRSLHGTYEQMERMERVPAFAWVMVDATGHLWLARYLEARDAAERPWDVVSPEGRWLGSIAFPANELPLEIEEDRMLVLRTDELGVEAVRVYELFRKRAAG